MEWYWATLIIFAVIMAVTNTIAIARQGKNLKEMVRLFRLYITGGSEE